MCIHRRLPFIHRRRLRRTGWGLALYQKGIIIDLKKGCGGPLKEVFDLEVEAIARTSISLRTKSDNGLLKDVNQIYIFTDNTSSIQAIWKANPKTNQRLHTIARRNFFRILDSNPLLSITFEWTPSHKGIVGNEKADSLAKEGCSQPPPPPLTPKSLSFVKLYWKRNHKLEWRDLWARTSVPRKSLFHVANNMPPSLKPLRRFRELNRQTFSRVFQVRTGHSHLGEYYRRFVPSEESSCPCSLHLQTRSHILLFCPLFILPRRALRDDKGELEIEALVGSPDGLDRLAEFLKLTNAFTKNN